MKIKEKVAIEGDKGGTKRRRGLKKMRQRKQSKANERRGKNLNSDEGTEKTSHERQKDKRKA